MVVIKRLTGWNENKHAKQTHCKQKQPWQKSAEVCKSLQTKLGCTECQYKDEQKDKKYHQHTSDVENNFSFVHVSVVLSNVSSICMHNFAQTHHINVCMQSTIQYVEIQKCISESLFILDEVCRRVERSIHLFMAAHLTQSFDLVLCRNFLFLQI